MNKRFQMKTISMATLSMVILAMLFALPSPAASSVGPAALVNCRDFAFSVEEDFVTFGPEPPDGNPVISDGDLLGEDCAVCARNYDLLHDTFDVDVDLGLDAVDVLNVDDYIVAFSTELDSPHGTQFTAGDLLITSIPGAIPNVALTYAAGPVGYDLGLDAVQFVGKIENILLFVGEIKEIPRDEWLRAPNTLSGMLNQYEIDLWFSTEGTWIPPEPGGGFLDGDLLSAASGVIVAANKDLLPPSVPAGIPDRGVDFGLDAVANDRGFERLRLHYSTEILYEGELNFTDGDVLAMGDGVVVPNFNLISCFEPKAEMLGLDALSFGVQEPAGCENRLTKISDVDVADISMTDGLIQTGTLPGINAPAPFGGVFEIHGAICDDVDKFRVKYRLEGSSDPWEPIKVLPSKNWRVRVDSFIPAWPDCDGSVVWNSDTDGWFSGAEYRHLSESGLGGCNPDLALTVWESGAAINGSEALYDVVLETQDYGGALSEDTPRLVQLDNKAPTVELEKDGGVCNALISTDFPYMVTGRMQDDHFHNYQIHLSGDGYPVIPYTPVAFYDDPTDNVIGTGTVAWDTWQGLHEVSLTDLDPNPVACGYTVMLTGWERTLFGWFTYHANLGTRCAGCRHDFDIWTFSYTP